MYFFDLSAPSTLGGSILILFAAITTGCTMLLMVVTQTEHPPAAGLVLGYVLSGSDLMAIFVVLVGITAISLIKELCKPLLIDLL